MWLTPHKTRVTLPSKKSMQLCSSQFLTKPMWHCGMSKGDLPQNASWKLGGGEVLQTLKNDRAVPDATDTCIEYAAHGSEGANFFCIRWENSEHHRRVNGEHYHRFKINQARVYVCSGRAGGNERHLLLFVRYVETWPRSPPVRP